MKIQSLIITVVTGLLALNIFCSLTYNQTSESILRGDTYFKLMRYKDAVAWYKLDSNRAEAQWKIARSYVCCLLYTSPSPRD